MDRELKEFLGLDGISKNLSLKKLIKYQLKYSLYFLILSVIYIATRLSKLKNDLVAISTNYGIHKACKRCTYGKSKETIIIVSGKGYSRDNRVLQIMNHNKSNWSNVGNCNGYTKCHNCINVIENKRTNEPCSWKKL